MRVAIAAHDRRPIPDDEFKNLSRYIKSLLELEGLERRSLHEVKSKPMTLLDDVIAYVNAKARAATGVVAKLLIPDITAMTSTFAKLEVMVTRNVNADDILEAAIKKGKELDQQLRDFTQKLYDMRQERYHLLLTHLQVRFLLF